MKVVIFQWIKGFDIKKKSAINEIVPLCGTPNFFGEGGNLMTEYMRFNKQSTLILNTIFLAIFPFVISIFKTDTWIVFPYLMLWSLIESLFDYDKYRPRRSTMGKVIARYIGTFAFNLTLIFGASLIIQNVMPIFGLDRLLGTLAMILILGVYVYVVSKLEDLIDYPLYVK